LRSASSFETVDRRTNAVQPKRHVYPRRFAPVAAIPIAPVAAVAPIVRAGLRRRRRRRSPSDLFELAWNERDRPKRFKAMEDLASRARAFAVRVHGDQQRKYENVPYVQHLDRVVALLKDHGFDAQHVVAAAYLHDTLEDTETTLQQLVEEFGGEVAELVYWLSDIEKGTRKTRKMMSAWRLSRAPLEAKARVEGDQIVELPLFKAAAAA
jgi:hypothetical protein